jgi:hypothetical protein
MVSDARGEMNSMQNAIDKCERLRRLHSRLTEELRQLKETREELEPESFENPVIMVSVIDSLQKTLNTIETELEACPPE